MNLEQIVKETVAKIVAEKKGKDLTGPNGKPDGKIDSADYLKARSNAIEKAKGLDEAANKIYITHKGPSDNPASNYMQYDLTFNGDEINAEEYEKGWKVIRYDDWEDEWKDVRNPKKQEIINFINVYNEKNLDNIKEEEDHEVSMAQSSLNSILRSAMELKAKIGNQEINIPAWIQDHITNSENFIDQASQGYHEYSNGGEHGEMDEGNLNHNEISSIEQEGRFWIVTYQTADGTKEKSFESEDEARKFYNGLDEAFVPKSSFDDYSIGDNVIVAGKKAKITAMKMDDETGERRARVRFEDDSVKDVNINSLDESQQELDEWTISRWQHYAGIK
jgi:hypothetical protein